MVLEENTRHEQETRLTAGYKGGRENCVFQSILGTYFLLQLKE